VAAALFIDPPFALIFLALLVLPAVVDFCIKKPSLPLLLFIFYHLLDDIFIRPVFPWLLRGEKLAAVT
jgi:hypothetical protein